MHFEVSQCLLQTALHLPRSAAVVVGLGIFRIEPDRLVEVRDRPVEVALGAPGAAAVDIGVPIFWMELGGLRGMSALHLKADMHPT
jgi:hypothetical protein